MLLRSFIANYFIYIILIYTKYNGGLCTLSRQEMHITHITACVSVGSSMFSRKYMTKTNVKREIVKSVLMCVHLYIVS